jgi:hypothetical protein
MKKVFALAVVLGLAACAPKEPAAPAMDTTSAAAPAAMSTDTTKPAMADTMKKDTTATAKP